MTISFTEIEPSESIEQAVTDWSILEEEGVMDVASRAARRVANQYERTSEFEDLLQVGYVFLATQHRQMRKALAEGGLGRLYHALWCDLTNHANAEMRKLSRNTSFEANLAKFDPEGV
jgi:hypothetical protein